MKDICTSQRSLCGPKDIIGPYFHEDRRVRPLNVNINRYCDIFGTKVVKVSRFQLKNAFPKTNGFLPYIKTMNLIC